MQLAEIGRKVGVDLWSYEAPAGGSIRKALDYLVRYTAPGSHWPAQEISPMEPDLLLAPLRVAEMAYADQPYRDLIEKIPSGLAQPSRIQLLYALPAR
jgi:hypothetical protein